MNREWRILTALEGTSVPHPSPLLFGGPDSPLSGPFLIMARVDGFNPVGVLPPPYDSPGARRDLAFALVDALAELAAVPWRERGLDGLGSPEGFLDRQVSRWLRQLDGYGKLPTYQPRDIPGLDWLANWLEANRPPGAARRAHARGLQPVQRHGVAAGHAPPRRGYRLGHRDDRRPAARHRPPASPLDRARRGAGHRRVGHRNP